MITPERNFGFTYKHDNKDYSFAICANSEEEARERAKRMGEANFFGELFEARTGETSNVEVRGSRSEA